MKRETKVRKSYRATKARSEICYPGSHVGEKFGKQLHYLNPHFTVPHQEEPTPEDPRPRRVKHRLAGHVGKEPK